MTPFFAQSFDAVPESALKNAALIIAGGLAALYYAKEIFFPRHAAATPQPFSVTGAPPDNSILARDLKSLGHRVGNLEMRHQQLVEKMDADKNAVIAAGEERERRILAHIETGTRDTVKELTFIRETLAAVNRELELKRD